ncbi:MAG: phosphoribosylamine--glycine ligase [Chloroflexi bacterium]|nr:phosphoribosylamine--glycine ligase [Chloroflexota bacterium]
MKLLVVGSGGREHALVWALARSPQATQLYVAPGNAGTARLATNVPIKADDVAGLVTFARQQDIDLVVVGPEIPLALGLVDALQREGIRAFGPTAAAAQLEASKAFSKAFMRQHRIPTGAYGSFSDYASALAYLDAHPAPIVLKADGLAAGKGVLVCQTDREAREGLQAILRDRRFGTAGERVVIEEYLTGQEVSVLAFSDGKSLAPMVLAQDHKAAYDGDRGPNTGGMGSYAPAPLLDPVMLHRVSTEVLEPVIAGMAQAGTPYVGVLYAGLMVNGDDLRVLEFNCRFGDPETQVILPLLKTDLLSIVEACVSGGLDQLGLEWSPRSAACVVLAADGYPGDYARGLTIEGLENVAEEDVLVFHAGTRQDGSRVITDGGRVLGVTGLGDTLQGALDRAYAAAGAIRWPGVFYRHDIGAKGLARGDA